MQSELNSSCIANILIDYISSNCQEGLNAAGVQRASCQDQARAHIYQSGKGLQTSHVRVISLSQYWI